MNAPSRSFTSSLFSSPRASAALFPRPALFTFLFSLFIAAFAAHPAANAATPDTDTSEFPLICNPYSFVGRITDAGHVAFDGTRKATLSAYNAEGKLLASSTTFYRDDTTHNYFLQIPMVTLPAEGNFALSGDLLAVEAKDDMGRVWRGVIDPARVGAPGGVSEVDIVLAKDTDGDGIDDSLLKQILADWYASGIYDPAIDFDPRADHDRDGISTLSETLLGTDPFVTEDVLQIESIEASEDGIVLKSQLPGGHVYAVEETTDLSSTNAWRVTEFYAEDSDIPRTMIVTPSSGDWTQSTNTIYLLPATGSSPTFYRISVTDIP